MPLKVRAGESASNQQGNASGAVRTIEVVPALRVVRVAQDIEINVRFRNEGKGAWTLYKPDESPYVSVRTGLLGEPWGSRTGLSFGRGERSTEVTPTGDKIAATSYKLPSTIKIPPMGSYEFRFVFACEADPVFDPGRFWVDIASYDPETKKVVSGRGEFRVTMTEESVARLFEIASKPLSNGRTWAIGYLSLIHPSSGFVRPPSFNDSPEEKLESENAIRCALNAFESHWSGAKGTKQSRQKMREIDELYDLKLKATIADYEEQFGKQLEGR